MPTLPTHIADELHTPYALSEDQIRFYEKTVSSS